MFAASLCCSALAATLPNITFPAETKTYNQSMASYYSGQEQQLQPSCVVTPSSTKDVSNAVASLAKSDCKFAVRSGGHTPTSAAANIDSGVTLDLSGLDSIELSTDESTISLGPGAVWADVYAVLEPRNLVVAGGRVASVGVGGLTTGGGLSFFSPRYGFTCDSVTNFEVVLASGEIVQANAKENANLLHALRGGSNNFGVVTRIDFQTHEQGPFWGGAVVHSLDTAPQQLKAVSDLASADPYDEYASLISTFVRSPSIGSAVTNTIQYTNDVENPAAFQDFMDIPHSSSTMRLANSSSFAAEGEAALPPGFRVSFSTVTHGTSLEMLNATFTAWNESYAAIQNVSGIAWSVAFEPLPPAIYNKAKSGTNSLGLSGQQESLMILLLSVGWADESDDALVMQTAQELVATIENKARQLGEYNEYVFLNYAGGWQDPITGYGEVSEATLKKASLEYDPEGVFQKLVPGGFKLF